MKYHHVDNIYTNNNELNINIFVERYDNDNIIQKNIKVFAKLL